MRLTQVLTDQDILLDYEMVTNPDPLGIGSTAFITFVVSAPEGPSVNVRQITFSLPVGDPDQPDPTDLTDTPLLRHCATISSTGTDVWTIVPGADPSLFIATPPDGTPIEVGPQGLTIMFTGIKVSPLVGTATIFISEWAAKGTGDPPAPDKEPPSGTRTVAVPKFPAGFYAGNFVAVPPEVQNGQPATLTWIGTTNGDYKIYSGIAAPVDVSSVRSWSTGNLSDVTSFVLEASAQEGGQTVFLYFSTTVTVVHPTIVADSLQVIGRSVLWGGSGADVGTTVKQGLQTDTIDATGTATVRGLLHAKAGATVTGGLGSDSLKVDGSLEVTGTATLSRAAIAGGTATLDSASIGRASATALSATGPVALIGGKVAREFNTTYTAATDGFLLAWIKPREGVGLIGLMAWWPGNPDDMLLVRITGGTPGDVDIANTGMIPVAQGQNYLASFDGEGPGIWAWWIPLGLHASGEP